jgi:Mannosyltransferase (PIG-V)
VTRASRPFWTLVWIRVAFSLGTAATLLWAPAAAGSAPRSRAWEPVTDLVFGTFDHWDAEWFLRIARGGYDEVSAAFFPLYPALVSLLGSSLVWGTLLSLVAAGIGAALVSEIARDRLGEAVAHDSVLVLALFPTAFVFTAVYSDGLFLALSAASFLAAQRRRPWLAALAGGLAVATRSMGLALLPALVYLLWPRSRRELWRLAPLLLLPAALGAYALFLDREVGDAFAFTNAQASGWDRELEPLGPLSGLWMAFQAGGHGALEILRHLPRTEAGGVAYSQALQVSFWNAAHLVLLVPLAWLTWVAWRRLGRALGLYAAATLLVILSVPSQGFPLVSMPRFVLTDFPVLIALASTVQGRPRLRTGVLVGLGAASAAAGIAFSRDVWIA